ncbi:MAG TPA: hypothetical protein VMX58_07350 [Patescibacteria group bacterium]|nr:hypothetical protein [Patescibacteria group bacterium]
MTKHARRIALTAIILLLSVVPFVYAGAERPAWIKGAMTALETEIVEKYGEGQRALLQRGMQQVADFWRDGDGGREAFEEFVRMNFAEDAEMRDAMFVRFENLLEALDGHMNAIVLAFHRQVDLEDLGPYYPFDEVFAGYAPAAHITDDFFANKLVFAVLLNFPLTTLEERLIDGKKWTRRQWAEARLAQRFSKRIPADVNLAIARAYADADNYIAGYNIWMHHLLDNEGRRLFPPKLRLLSHWNLRDELKANYADREHGMDKQRMIVKVMERIVDQTIPAVAVDNPLADWNPYTNEVTPAAVTDSDIQAPADMKVTNAPEPDTRYRMLLNTFLAARMVDPYSPSAPTHIARRFDEDREIPEEQVEEMFVQIVSSPLVSRVAKLIEARLGRPLEPFDIWYNGFRTTGAYGPDELDEIVSKRYPTPDAYRNDMPRMLEKLGFTKERAAFLAGNILVEPARGSGHAWGGEMRGQKARLRTRVGAGGMDYKGFNIAVHEMGHNVEQVISLDDIDYTLLRGVPNTAFTEAFAYVFQEQDLMLLDLDIPVDKTDEAIKALHDFWMMYEITGVSLVDMKIWHWMYDHPDATPAELRTAVMEIARDVWNSYYAPVFGEKDVTLFAIYSHIIHSQLYLPDYALGHLILVQVREQMTKAGNIGGEFERMARAGNVAPDLWMENATGEPVGAEAMLEATGRALDTLKE